MISHLVSLTICFRYVVSVDLRRGVLLSTPKIPFFFNVCLIEKGSINRCNITVTVNLSVFMWTFISDRDVCWQVWCLVSLLKGTSLTLLNTSFETRNSYVGVDIYRHDGPRRGVEGFIYAYMCMCIRVCVSCDNQVWRKDS